MESLASFAVSNCIDFNDFADAVLDHVIGLSKNSTMIDVVADMYYRHSIKGPTRKSRGTSGVRFILDGDAELPSHLMTFCRTKTTSHSSTSS